MTARTYDELFTPQTRLRLIPVDGGYTVRDQTGQAYVLAPVSFAFAARFMRAMQERKDALIDEDSVLRWYRHEHWKAHKTASSERGPQAAPDPVSPAVPHDEPAPLSEYSVRVPSNVYPLWKDSA